MNNLNKADVEVKPGKDHAEYMSRTRVIPEPVSPSILAENNESYVDSTYTRLKKKIAELLARNKREKLIEQAQTRADEVTKGNRTARQLGIRIGRDLDEED